jgi:endoglucanase
LIKKLSNEDGVSGDEKAVRRLIQREIEDYVDKMDVDKMGNLVCKKKGKKKDNPIIIAAHMDEIGLMVNEIDEYGHIFFSQVGVLSKQTLLGQKVHILCKKSIHGVITHKRLHKGEESETFPEDARLYIDTGLSRYQLKKMGVMIGTYIVPERKFGHLGDKKIISGKALDDRIGCAILIHLAKYIKKPPSDVYYVFTAQEEVGLYGAKTSMYKIDANWGIVVDVTFASDYSKTGIGLGKGPAITIKDSELIANRTLVNALIKLAKKGRIPYQPEVSEMGTTDALSISISKGGIPATAVEVPVRNLHSTISIANFDDVLDCIRLLTAFIKNPP